MAQSSFEAWTKLYNGGEDAINSSTSYYVQGALAAFCLDTWLRAHSEDGISLQMIMHRLWHNYHRSGEGIDEARFLRLTADLLPEELETPLRGFLHRLIHSTEELPLEDAAGYLGLTIHMQPAACPGDLSSNAPGDRRCQSSPGFHWKKQHGRHLVSRLNEHSAAALAGIAVDDDIIAVNGYRADDNQLARHLHHGTSGNSVTLHAFRDNTLQTFTFTLEAAAAENCRLERDPEAGDTARTRQRHWLNRSQEEHD